MTHQAEVTHIVNWAGTLNIYLAECSCGWSGGRYFNHPEKAQAQVDQHLRVAR